MRIQAHGLGLELPPGWDGRIGRRPDALPVAHAASFALPAEDGVVEPAGEAQAAAGDVLGRLEAFDGPTPLAEHDHAGPAEDGGEDQEQHADG